MKQKVSHNKRRTKFPFSTLPPRNDELMNRIIAENLSLGLINRRINVAVSPFSPPIFTKSERPKVCERRKKRKMEKERARNGKNNR